MDNKTISFPDFWVKFQKIQFAIIKKMAIESSLQISMTREILSKVAKDDLDQIQKEYQKRYDLESQRLKNWVNESMGVDSIDWVGLFGYDPFL